MAKIQNPTVDLIRAKADHHAALDITVRTHQWKR
jgi:hypothetical protein